MPEQEAHRGRFIHEIRQAARIHTSQIEDACLDKDCIEDLRVYLTAQSQVALDAAAGARARSAELLHVSIDVEPVLYHRGHFTADLTFFYRITGETVDLGLRPSTLTGLAVFSKRVVLEGGESGAKVFSSAERRLDRRQLYRADLPTCVVEAVDPMILTCRVAESCVCPRSGRGPEIPEAIGSLFEDPLVTEGEGKRLLISLGQFSTVRMERSAQLLVPAFEYTMPEKTCTDDLGTPDEPCELFSRVDFPTDAFFPESRGMQQVLSEQRTGQRGS